MGWIRLYYLFIILKRLCFIDEDIDVLTDATDLLIDDDVIDDDINHGEFSGNCSWGHS